MRRGSAAKRPEVSAISVFGPLATLRSVLPLVEWDALLSVRAELPLWLAQLLSEQALEPQKARG
jgi:hypothetical protein